MANIRENKKNGKVVSYRFISYVGKNEAGEYLRKYTTWKSPEGVSPSRANRPFNPLWLDADVPLCGGCGAVLKQPLDKGNVIAVVLVDFRCVPFTEAVSADAVKAEVITDDGKLLLYCPLGDGENQLILFYAITKAVVFDVLLNDEGNGEDASLAGLLLCNLKAVSVAIPHNA